MTTSVPIVQVKCSKQHFFEALIADQMHDFLLHTGADERASSIATVFEVFETIEDKPSAELEKLVRLWRETIDPKNPRQFKCILDFCSSRALQQNAELIVAGRHHGQGDAATFEHGTHVSEFVPISQVVDREDTIDKTSDATAKCKMFDAPLSSYVRPLDANEFDCFISLLREYNIMKHGTDADPLITIVVDATKNRDVTLMSNLALRLKKRDDSKEKWLVQAMFQTTLPNMFDQAGSDTHVTEQRNMNFLGIHRPESSCEFEINVDPKRSPFPKSGTDRHVVQQLSGSRLMKFKLSRLPNVFEVMYHYTQDLESLDSLDSLDELQPSDYHELITRCDQKMYDERIAKTSEFYRTLITLFDQKMHDELFKGKSQYEHTAAHKALIKSFFTGSHSERPEKNKFLLYERFGSSSTVGDEGYIIYDALSPVLKVKRLIKTMASIYQEIQHRWSETCNLSFPTIVDHMLAWLRAKDANQTPFEAAFIAAYDPNNVKSGTSLEATPSPPADTQVRDKRSRVKKLDVEKTVASAVAPKSNVFYKAPADFMFSVCIGDTPTRTFQLTIRSLLIKWSVLLDFLNHSTGPLDMKSFGYVYSLLHPHEQAICSELTLFGNCDQEILFEQSLKWINQFFTRDWSGPSVANIGNTLLEIYAKTRHEKCTAHLTGTEETMVIVSNKSNTVVKLTPTPEVEYKLDNVEFEKLFAAGYITYDHKSTKPNQSFDKKNFYKTVLCAMLLKTLCDLSMTTWCAYRNQNRASNDKHILLTFDRISASISTLFAEMEHYILFQSVESHKKTICVHPKNCAFTMKRTLDCFQNPETIKKGHELIYGNDSIEYATFQTLLKCLPARPSPESRGVHTACGSVDEHAREEVVVSTEEDESTLVGQNLFTISDADAAHLLARIKSKDGGLSQRETRKGGAARDGWKLPTHSTTCNAKGRSRQNRSHVHAFDDGERRTDVNTMCGMMFDHRRTTPGRRQSPIRTTKCVATTFGGNLSMHSTKPAATTVGENRPPESASHCAPHRVDGNNRCSRLSPRRRPSVSLDRTRPQMFNSFDRRRSTPGRRKSPTHHRKPAATTVRNDGPQTSALEDAQRTPVNTLHGMRFDRRRATSGRKSPMRSM